jgi:hypothetical protein
VYLVFNAAEKRWDIDPVVFDGYTLDGLIDPEERDDVCECKRGKGHAAVLDAAAETPLPTGRELVGMLVSAYVEHTA